MLKSKKFRIKGFTLLESLLVLSVTSFVVLSFSATFKGVLSQVEEDLFFLSFEHLYRDSQSLSALRSEPVQLVLSDGVISNGQTSLALPKGVTVENGLNLRFDHGSGNSSMKKISFQTRQKTIRYQLYMGSGKYKKTEN